MKKRDFISLICQAKNTLFFEILGAYLQFPNRTLLNASAIFALNAEECFHVVPFAIFCSIISPIRRLYLE